METSLNRNEKILAFITVGAILGFAALFTQINFHSSSVSQIDTRLQVNYKMARPEETYSEYSLNGREIDQVYEGLAHKEAAKKAAVAASKPKTEAQKKADEAKKKTEAAQKSLALARSQAQARSAQAADQARKTAFAQQARMKPVDAKPEAKKNEIENSNGGNGVAAAPTKSEAHPEDPNADKSKEKKSYAQWRSLVFAQPTRETMNQFLDAYKKGEVTATEVQAMAQDLLDQNDDKFKGLGLYTLRAAPSLASLSQLVHIETQMSATYKSYIDQAYLAYLQPQNVGYLNQALLTKDKTLVLKSLNLLGVNLQKVAKGDNSAFADPRNGRVPGAGSNITLSSFSGLVPALTTLISSQDQEVAPLAQQVMAYIQSSNNVAQN